MDLLPRSFAVFLLCVLFSGHAMSMMFGNSCGNFFCTKTCISGYKRDFRGCKMCQCRFSSNTGKKTQTQSQFTQANYRPVVLIPVKCKKLTCDTTCSNGRERDSKGCETCTCKSSTNTGMMNTMGNMGMMNTMGNMGMMNNGMMNNMGNMGMMNTGMMNTGMMNTGMMNTGMLSNYNKKKVFNNGFSNMGMMNTGMMNTGMFGNMGMMNTGMMGTGMMNMGNMMTGFNPFNNGFNSFIMNSGSGFLSVPCPNGIFKVSCPMSPCLSAKCPSRPFATCVESYCGGCHAAFYQNKKRIFC